MKNKLGNIKLLKVECDMDIFYHHFASGWINEGVATYRLRGIKHKVKFCYQEEQKTNIPKVFYLEDNKSYIPKDRLDNEALLVLIYGEIQKFKGKIEMINFFKIRRIEEEKRKKEEEEKKKQIALGEQISFEKYLKNK